MKKEISKEVHDALQGMPGIILSQELRFFMETEQQQLPLPPSTGKQLDLMDVNNRITRRSPNMRLRLTNGYSQRKLTSDTLYKAREIAAALLRAETPIASRELAARMAPKIHTKNSKNDASYYIMRLIKLGVLEEYLD